MINLSILQAILSAWKEACAWDGMGRILIPKETFIVGPLVLKGPCKGPIVFQLKGVMKAHTDLSIFKSDVWIEFQYVKGLLVTGGGTLDGQGASAWPHNQCPKNFKCKILPTSLKLSFVTDATVQGISSINSKFFHMNIFGSKNIKLQAVNISAPDESPNTDGIHIGSSSGIKISRSIIGTGDDCISLGPGSSNVSISNIFCGPGHGISVGSLGKYPNEEDVVGLTVRNCTFTGTTNGLRIKTWEASPASTTASSFTFDDIVMNNVYNPIIIDQEYCPYKSCNLETPSRVKIDNVSFKNIRGTSSSQVAVNILCSKGVPCQNVKLIDINLAYIVQGVAATAACANVRGTSSGLQIPPSCI
ncbi:Glycoside hydrolase [Cinnamomum micranthum f. kanehirae]|uniref:Glycoside hydrolase n=1 Tax=Cinnamomum micranthum f. kanehirae TaxID=337451 RepID=A0A443N0P8_9MAGN|nr:Glycoside hydrolase [Cinnamomum micranthum f. kanehirae]